jgi:hypothetical protein
MDHAEAAEQELKDASRYGDAKAGTRALTHAILALVEALKEKK